jgi:hypothetical protein
MSAIRCNLKDVAGIALDIQPSSPLSRLNISREIPKCSGCRHRLISPKRRVLCNSSAGRDGVTLSSSVSVTVSLSVLHSSHDPAPPLSSEQVNVWDAREEAASGSAADYKYAAAPHGKPRAQYETGHFWASDLPWHVFAYFDACAAYMTQACMIGVPSSMRAQLTPQGRNSIVRVCDCGHFRLISQTSDVSVEAKNHATMERMPKIGSSVVGQRTGVRCRTACRYCTVLNYCNVDTLLDRC